MNAPRSWPGGGSAACAGNNLALNGGFENGYTGWFAEGGTLMHVTGGHSGSGSSEAVCTGSPAPDCTLDDEQPTVNSPTEGSHYAANAWVRCDGCAAGREIKLWLRQWANGAGLYQDHGATTLSSDWASLAVMTTIHPTATSMDVYLELTSANAGDSFRVDDICVVAQ